jgi:murein DD-endopeptidase MepM/ murein hydrolase activator NlpD
MNIIIVADKGGANRHASLSHRHVLVIALVGLLFLPIFLGGMTYQIRSTLDRHSGATDADLVAQQQKELQVQRLAIQAARSDAETHLNALAQRLGHLQAQVLRLNALGGRLTSMAGLDPQEFDFTVQPAMGGPAEPTAAQDASLVLSSLSELDQQVAVQTEQLSALETLLIDKQLQKALMPSGWPVKGGWVSSSFGFRADPFNGRRSMHKGVDIASPLGSPIHAMGEGVVTFAGKKRGYGNMVEINHGQGYSTRYAHVAEWLVKVGDRVTRGQPVAKVGLTGRSTGPHLHFEVLRSHRQVDPVSYLNGPRSLVAHK